MISIKDEMREYPYWKMLTDKGKVIVAEIAMQTPLTCEEVAVSILTKIIQRKELQIIFGIIMSIW